jgi:preprotein translocase subunit SecD
MNLQARVAGFIAAFIFAWAGLSAPARSDPAHDLAKMRATIAASADKALQAQGGSRILLKVDADALRELVLTEVRDDLYRIVREGHIPFAGLALHEGDVEVRIVAAKDRELVLSKLQSSAAAARQGALAVANGDDGLIRLTPTDAAFTMRRHELVEQSTDMTEQLLRNSGITQVGLRADGADRISVVLPGIRDPERVTAILTKKRQVTFRLVDVSTTPERALKGSVPSGSEVLYGFKDKTPHLVLKEAVLDGDDIIDVAPGLDPATHQAITSFRFNARGARRFAHVTEENIGRPLAIVADDQVLSAFVIREPILGGSGQISGNLTLEGANTIAMLLRAGTLPGHLSVIEQQIVEPTGNVGK